MAMEEENTIDGKEGKFSGFVLDPEKCSQLTLVEKRELVHEISQWPEDAPKILSSFTRRELLEIICAEMGKERKYTGLAKGRMIEILLNVVLTNKRKEHPDAANSFLPVKSQPGLKRHKKTEDLKEDYHIVDGEVRLLLCENLACRATLSGSADGFCRRCSCCICHSYDENKDPSLWLTCNSDPPNGGDSCGLSCHLKCALKHERAGILKNGYKLEGKFSCVACGKVNDLMATWRKQLVIAKEARRVDALCLRISLCYKILDGTKSYKDLHKPVEIAAKKLKKEMGPLDRVCAKMGRGIVNRLGCGAEVQKLCTSALEIYHTSFSNTYLHSQLQHKSPTCRIRFEECNATSVMVVLDYEDHLFEDLLGCRIWYQESSLTSFPDKPTCILSPPEKKLKIGNLNPSTEYTIHASLVSHTHILATHEANFLTLSDPNKKHQHQLQHQHLNLEKIRSLHEITNAHITTANLPLVSPFSIPSTPSKADGRVRQSENADFDYCVRVIKALESEGHLNLDFRVKFLTWYSLKANKEQRRVVSAFVDVMGDEPSSLAEQLMDAFEDEICVKCLN